MKKILWLATWYPNDADAFTGDFIQRHARATALFQSLIVLYIGKKTERPRIQVNPPETVTGLSENRLYYRGSKPGNRTKLRSARLYLSCFFKWFRFYRKQNGLPDLVHVHVAMRAGLLALYLKKRYGIAYVVTEHWTGYFNDSAHPLSKKNRLYRMMLKMVLRHAAVVMPVSADLGHEMMRLAGPLPVNVIPNAVDTRQFYLRTSSRAVFRFIHVSSMTAVKNPGGILKAFCALISAGNDAELVMIGPVDNLELSSLPHLEKIRFTGEITYNNVAEELRNADVFLLFSQRENQPCVILEALCCGVPVIATRTGGIPELIDDTNGVLVEPGNEQELAHAMKNMMATYQVYDAAAISLRAAKQFSYDATGKAYANIYEEVSANKKYAHRNSV